MAVDVEGPAWSRHGLDVAAGRFPLSVESHVMQMVGKLVPGVTTVTLNARYYALHALAAVEVDRRGLDAPEALDLLRRMEVVLGGVSILHDHGDNGLARAHGADAIGPQLRGEAQLRVAEISRPGKGRYVEAQSGY